MRMHRTASGSKAWALGACAGLALACGAMAGGGPENVLIIIDPTSPESLYLGNYYKNARNIPDSNVLYIDPDAANYPAFGATQVPGFLGTLTQRRLDDHIDYVVVAPGNGFFLPAPGLVSDGCFPVGRFSIGSVFTMAFIKDEILTGPMGSTNPNRYFSNTPGSPVGFDSNTSYLGGLPSTNAAARRYFIGALLGYSGTGGNTLDEIKAMIDSSIAADGTRPAGTFLYMNNTGDPIRNVRACGTSSCGGPTPLFNAALTALTGLGGNGAILVGALPPGPGSSLGIMTGFANSDIAGMNVTITPGMFCDHLTSFACEFNADQSKASEWIRKGASGSAGTVDEPCNYPGKFPTANLYVFYRQGMSMGEAYLRTLAYTPFQQLFLGDPITRAFTHIPSANVPNPPVGTVSGTIQISPVAQTTHPTASISSLDLLIDGVKHSTIASTGAFILKTAHLADGRHDLRVLAYDSTLTKSVGRWVGTLTTDNFGRACTLGAPLTAGDLSTLFTFNVGGTGGTIKEIRLKQNGRVVGARTSTGAIQIRGQTIGAGATRLTAETEFTDGRLALSPPVTLDIDFAPGSPSGLPPTAFSYTKTIIRGAGAAVVELPATYDSDPGAATYNILSTPAQGTLSGSGAWRVLTPNAGACGQDSLQFRVHNAAGQSTVATVTLRYILPPVACPADFNTDGLLTIADFGAYQTGFVGGDPRADFTSDCVLTIADFGAFQTAFVAGCP